MSNEPKQLTPLQELEEWVRKRNIENPVFYAVDLIDKIQSLKEREESIECPDCDGKGFTEEHNNHSPEEPCHECPVQIPCGFCLYEGRITTKLLKSYNEQLNTHIEDDNLPF